MDPSTSEEASDSTSKKIDVEKQLCVSRVESYLDSSDIERISDEDDDDMGSFSLLLESMNSGSLIDKEEAIESEEAKSDASTLLEASSNDDTSPLEATVLATTRIHSYVHTPNRKLNLNLNFLMVVSIATVIGLGVGHFLGYSSQVLIQKQQSDSAVSNDTSDARTPLEDTAWRIFAENELLQTALDKANHEIDKYSQHGNQAQQDKAIDSLLSGYRKLKLRVIMKQLENVDILNGIELLKNAELDNVNRLLVHSDENLQVDGAVENVEAANAEVLEKGDVQLTNDSASEQTVNLEANHSSTWNESSGSDHIETMDSLIEINSSKQELSDLKLENSQLHALIAKLRNREPQRLESSEPDEEISIADGPDVERIELNSNAADVKQMTADSHEREVRIEQTQSKLCNETTLEGRSSVENVLQMVVCILRKIVKEESPIESDENERLLKLITDLLENGGDDKDRLTAGHDASKVRNMEEEQLSAPLAPSNNKEESDKRQSESKKVETRRGKVKQKAAKKDGDGDSWMFKRAQSRDKKRKEQRRSQSGSYDHDKDRRDRKRDRHFDTKYANKYQKNSTSKSKKHKGRYTEESSYDSDRVEIKKRESRETWDSSSAKLRRDRLQLNLKQHSHFSSR